jgi:hypothetical protein
MPSAEELRDICANYDAINDFVWTAARTVELAARSGMTSEYVEIPDNLTKDKAKAALFGNFPNCKITSGWFTRCFKVSWAK